MAPPTSSSGYLSEHYREGASLAEALALAVAALGRSTDERGEPQDRVIPVKDLEVAVLDRTRAQPRKFARIGPYRLEALLGDRGADDARTPARRTPRTRPAPAATDARPRRPAATRPTRSAATYRRCDGPGRAPTPPVAPAGAATRRP